MARRGLSRSEWACVALVALAFLVRLSFALQPTFIWDSAWYLTLARSFGETGTFLVPWTDPPQYSGYWPPLYPILLSPFVKLFGPSYGLLVAAASVASALLTLAVFVATRDLFGRPRAFAAAAAVACSPSFLLTDNLGMSESLLALLVTLTVWTFLKSLQRPAWLLPTAVFAFLAYLAKATLGVPIVVGALVAGLAWRVRTRGLAKSRLELALGGAALVALAALAFARSGRLGGVGVGVIGPVAVAVREPTFVLVLSAKLVFLAAFLLAISLPFSLKVREAWKDRSTDRGSALWLAVALPLVAAAIFTSSFHFAEKRPLVDFDNIRYLTPAFVPFLWLTIPHWPVDAETHRPADVPDPRLRRRHETWFTLAVASLALILLLNPVAGAANLTRLFVLFALLLVPLGLALAAFATRYRVSSRKTPRGSELRYEPVAGGGNALGVLALLAAGGALAYWFSAWYIAVAVGLLVALATASPRARIVAMCAILLVSTAPNFFTNAPESEAAAALAAHVPKGSVVAVTEPAVYFAAIAPAGYTLRGIENGIPPENASAIVANAGWARGEYPNFTKVQAWDYRFDLTPALAARVALERALGTAPELQSATAVALYVRNGTAAP